MKIFIYLLLFLVAAEKEFSQVVKNYWYQQGPYGGSVTDISVSDENKIAVISNERTVVLNYEWVDVTNGDSIKQITYFPGTPFLLTIKGNSILKTSDNGYHWFNVFTSEDSLKGLTLITDTSKFITWSSDNIYIVDYNAQEFDSIKTGINNLAIYSIPGNDSSLYVTSDSGLYYTEMFSTEFIRINSIKKINSMISFKSKPALLIASSSITDSIYISSDKGNSWQSVKLGNENDLLIFHLIVDSTNDIIYAATNNGIYNSIDYGESWNLYSAVLTFPYFGKETILKVNRIFLSKDAILAGTDEGLFRKAFSESEWRIIGPFNESVLSLGKNVKYYNEKIFAGTPRGIKYFDYNEWKVTSLYSMDSLPINTILTSNSEENGTVLAASVLSADIPVIYQSVDEGQNWKKVFVGDSGSGKINQFIQNPDSLNVIYALCENKNGKAGLFKSSSSGDSLSWQIVSSDDKSFTYAIKEYYTNDIYMLVNQKELYKLLAADTLKYVSTLPGNYYHSLYSSKFNNYLYAAGDGVKRTTDYTNWENYGLDTTEVVELVEDYSSLFAATKYNGMYADYYTNGTWWEYDAGLPKGIEITDIVNFSHGVLHIGTRSNSVFMQYTIINKTDENKNSPSDFSLHQNYPNPFNPTTKIGFGISDFGFVTLKVYDILGNEVAKLVNEEKPVGEYEVEFDGSKFSSGIYFYVLNAGGNVISKKMSLIK